MGNVCSRNVSAPKSQATPTRTRFRSVAERSRHEHDGTDREVNEAIAEIEKALQLSSATVDEGHVAQESGIDEDHDPSNPFDPHVNPPARVVQPLPSWLPPTVTDEGDGVKEDIDVRSPVPMQREFAKEGRYFMEQPPVSGYLGSDSFHRTESGTPSMPGCSTSGSYRGVSKSPLELSLSLSRSSRSRSCSRSTSSFRSISLERQRSPRVVEFSEEPDVGTPHSVDLPEPTLRSNSNSSRLDGSVQQEPPATLA